MAGGAAHADNNGACDQSGHAGAAEGGRSQEASHLRAFVAARLAPSGKMFAVVRENAVARFAQAAFGAHHDAIGVVGFVANDGFDAAPAGEFGHGRALDRCVPLVVEEFP